MADLTRNTQGKVTGIGAQLQSKDGQVIVVTPLFDSPALKAGIRPGDVIDEVDGKPTRGLEITEVVKRIIGKEGEVVRLKVRHADGRAEELAVTRGVVTIPSVSGFRSSATTRSSCSTRTTRSVTSGSTSSVPRRPTS